MLWPAGYLRVVQIGVHGSLWVQKPNIHQLHRPLGVLVFICEEPGQRQRRHVVHHIPEAGGGYDEQLRFHNIGEIITVADTV